MVIEIVTLLLGIVLGVHPVELAVSPEVARVELWLDGERKVARSEPPWELHLDLGPVPRPRRLEAVAYDAAGEEIGRAGKAVNFHRATEELTIVLDGGGGDDAVTGRVVWASIPRRAARRVDLRLDGAAVAVGADGGFRVAVEAGAVHALTAEVELEGLAEPLTAELAFGGDVERTARMTSALTPVAVRLPAGLGRPPAPGELHGWLSARGRPLAVFGADRPPPTLLVVRDVHARKAIQVAAFHVLRSALVLPGLGDDALRRLFVRTQPRTEEAIFDVVPPPDDLGVRADGVDLPTLVSWRQRVSDPDRPQQLAEAVAVASAHGGAFDGPRAVLALVGGDGADTSRFDLPAALAYAARVNVPVWVWAADADAAAAWGVADASRLRLGTDGLIAVTREIADELARQQILWVVGEHMPHEIAPGPAAPAGFAVVR